MLSLCCHRCSFAVAVAGFDAAVGIVVSVVEECRSIQSGSVGVNHVVVNDFHCRALHVSRVGCEAAFDHMAHPSSQASSEG